MKATTRNMAEAITAALGPIFQANPDYKTISEAMALTLARVAQATHDRGFELFALDSIHELANRALEQFLDEEQALQEAKAKVLAKGIDGFAEMCGPANGLAAINGGVSPEARAKAEAFAGQDHPEVVEDGPWKDDDGELTEAGLAAFEKQLAEMERPACRPCRDADGDITPEGRVQLKKDILDLHTPDEENWSNSPIHQEIARFEQENPNVGPDGDPGYNPDGPRAYL